jgi:hypothetical protein
MSSECGWARGIFALKMVPTFFCKMTLRLFVPGDFSKPPATIG